MTKLTKRLKPARSTKIATELDVYNSYCDELADVLVRFRTYARSRNRRLVVETAKDDMFEVYWVRNKIIT